jgi:hypothetical protein
MVRILQALYFTSSLLSLSQDLSIEKGRTIRPEKPEQQ